MYLVGRLYAIFAFDDDVKMLKFMYGCPAYYFGRIKEFGHKTRDGVIEMSDGSGDRNVYFIHDAVDRDLRVGQDIKFLMQEAVGVVDLFAVWNVTVISEGKAFVPTTGSFR